jgi:hypothetical protein
MSTLADQRGWGPGWPNCQDKKMITITAGGIRLRVRPEVAPIFKAFCDELVERGYPLKGTADDWGFACRPIRGTEKRPNPIPSNHSWGLAIDLNAEANPRQETLKTNFPDWAVELGEKKYRLGWGGRYQKMPDAMHWEWLQTPEAALKLVAELGLTAEHVHIDTEEEELMGAKDDIIKHIDDRVNTAVDAATVRLEADIRALGDKIAALTAALPKP